jgi:hypothetical protein
MPPPAFKKGGLVKKSMGGTVSKVRPPGGRGTKSCKIC